jgi:hypothetical protein
VMVQFAALGTMIFALWAVVKYNFDQGSPALATMHSWIGVGAIAVFVFNFIWGCAMGYMTMYRPTSSLRARLKPLLSHKFLGVVALLLSVTAICTGVMDQLSRGSCSYALPENKYTYEKDYDPAEHYSQVPTSCKIGNGLGIAAVVTGIFTVMLILVRNGENRKSAAAAAAATAAGAVAVAPSAPAGTGTDADRAAQKEGELEMGGIRRGGNVGVVGAYAVVAPDDSSQGQGQVPTAAATATLTTYR